MAAVDSSFDAAGAVAQLKTAFADFAPGFTVKTMRPLLSKVKSVVNSVTASEQSLVAFCEQGGLLLILQHISEKKAPCFTLIKATVFKAFAIPKLRPLFFRSSAVECACKLWGNGTINSCAAQDLVILYLQHDVAAASQLFLACGGRSLLHRFAGDPRNELIEHMIADYKVAKERIEKRIAEQQ